MSSSVVFGGEGTDSIGTRSIANSFGSDHNSKASSCKSISDPNVLFSKAVLDLKRSARECEEDAELSEYWDAWNYWKRHPFVSQNILLSGQLLLEHLLILTNLHYRPTAAVFADLQNWLQLTTLPDSCTEKIIQLRDQLCAGFFLIYCEDGGEAQNLLLQVEHLLAAEYFSALKEELTHRKSQNVSQSSLIAEGPNSRRFQVLQRILFNFAEFAKAVLTKLEGSHAFLVAAVRGNSRSFYQFCAKLFAILWRKIRELLIL